MGRLIAGATIILFVIVVGALLAFIKVGAEETFTGTGCGTGNATQCAEEGGESGFRDFVDAANPAEIDEDAPAIVNSLWLLVIVFLVLVAGLLIVLAFVPLTSE